MDFPPYYVLLRELFEEQERLRKLFDPISELIRHVQPSSNIPYYLNIENCLPIAGTAIELSHMKKEIENQLNHSTGTFFNELQSLKNSERTRSNEEFT